VKVDDPAATDAGERPAMAGTGLLAGLVIVKVAGEDVPPGVTTATVAVPAFATSPSVIAAVNCVELT
jgi:hypothetical protein